MFGFLNVYKPQGKTSHDVVGILRRITGVKQIGHTGTLDPFAEGVLPICIGKATRLIEYMKDDKAYVGTVQLGKSTTTYDVEGETVGVNDDIKPDIQEIEQALQCFRGEITQLPPIYSAIKVKGKKLYEYARKGEEVKIEPRVVNIYKLEVVNYNKELRQLELYIECSKGTYIRSIANDLGEKLGTYGHLIKLIRVKAGDFAVNKAVKLENLQTKEDVQNNLIYPLEYLDYPKYELNDTEKKSVSNGMPINVNFDDGFVLLIYKNNLIAVAEACESKLLCRKVFV